MHHWPSERLLFVPSDLALTTANRGLTIDAIGGAYYTVADGDGQPFAHLFETGGMRRVYLRGHENIRKRLLIHTSGFNLGLLMRRLFGVGTPRGLRGRALAALTALITLLRAMGQPLTRHWPFEPLLLVHPTARR